MLKNSMYVEFPAISENESFARSVAAALAMSLDPTLDELSEIKTAISEAVTNAIIHGYDKRESENVVMEGFVYDDIIEYIIRDNGVGISDIRRAMQPLYTGHPDEERSGMGFTIMESFMDGVCVESEIGKGTTVTMKKRIKEVGRDG